MSAEYYRSIGENLKLARMALEQVERLYTQGNAANDWTTIAYFARLIRRAGDEINASAKSYFPKKV